MFEIILKSKDGRKFECKCEKEIYNEEEIKKIAFEKIKKEIPDYESFNYKIDNIRKISK